MVKPTTRPRQLQLFAIAALLAAIFLCRPAHAQAPVQEFWGLPDASIAFLAFDPRPLGPDPTCQLFQAGVRALIDNIAAVDGGGSPIVSDLLAPGVLGESAYRICLLELGAELPTGPVTPDRPITLTKLSLIVEIRAKPPHESLVEVLRTAVSRDHAARRAPPASESLIDLPDGRRATRLSRVGDSEWREVTWCSTAETLLIGVGHEALERWFAAPLPSLEPLSEWNLIRTSVFQRRESTVPILDAGVDLDALRRILPQEFAAGRLGRLTQTWHIPNARTVMLLARLSPKDKEATAAPLLCVDLGWSVRSQPPGTVRSAPLTEATWPDGLELPRPAPDARYAAVIRGAWAEWVPLALDTWTALTPRANSAPLIAKLKWMRAHARALDRLTDRAGPWVQFCGPNPTIPAFVTSFDAPPVTGDTLDGDLREVFGTLSASIKPEPAKRFWALAIGDAPPPLNQFAWTRQSNLLMGAWDPGALAPAKPRR